MEAEKIKVILNSYYAGTASEKEENLLYEYFSGNDVSDELADEKDYFISLYDMQRIPVNIPEGFDKRLEKFIDSLDNYKNQKIKKCKKPFVKTYFTIGIAASVLILMVAGLYFDSKKDKYEISETDRMALAKAESAIVLFSTKVNKGIKQLEIAGVTTEKVVNSFNKYENKNENN